MIIEAAIGIFARKGRHGARMEEIARAAKVNKAMVYYYFSTKDNLYRQVVTEIAARVSREVERAVTRCRSLAPVERLVQMVKAHFRTYSRRMDYARVMLDAIVSEPELVRVVLKDLRKKSQSVVSDNLLLVIEEGVAKKVFRDVNPLQTLISIMGMNMIYFIGEPIARALLSMPAAKRRKFLDQRMDSVIDLLLYGVSAK